MKSIIAPARSVDELMALVNEAGDTIRAEAEYSSEIGRTSPNILNALESRGLLRLFAPREFGGDDLGPIDSIRMLAAVTELDGSTGWTTMALNGHHRSLMLLEKDVVADLFRNGPPHVAGQMAATGKAEKADGGYRITGHWEYGSGIHHAEYVLGAAQITVGGEIEIDESGSPRIIVFFTPRENVRVLENWDVVGLEASGSVDYEVEDLFVPTEMVAVGGPRADLKWGGSQTLIDFGGWLMVMHTGVEIGLGRPLLDEVRAYALSPTRVRGRLADQQAFRIGYVQAEARYRSAVAWVWEVWNEIQEWTLEGNRITRFQASQARNALLHLSRVNRENGRFAFEEAGGYALRRGRLNRAFRDQIAASQHMHVSRKFYDDLGRDYLGEADGLRWTPHFLIEE
jgi:indole-3-acetate monooxygenase